jgi:transposase
MVVVVVEEERDMTRKPNRRRKQSNPPIFETIQPHAAGIDVGATEIYVAVPADRDPQPVRCFLTFTEDLQALADWLQKCGVESVAMEATGVYWIPLFQILEARTIQVCLVNARHVKHVPGRKSDVMDCQWLQYLHSVGLLRASFRPEQAICMIRSLLRHRDSLVAMAAVHIQHMQKALTQMNLQLHHVISDITGSTGMAILDAIVAGQRDPQILAQLRDPRVKAPEETIAKALAGDYRREHLFALQQSIQAYRNYQKLVADCDLEIEQYLVALDPKVDVKEEPLSAAKYPHKPRRNEFRFDLRSHLYRIFGVDLTAIPGMDAVTAHTVLAEIGADLSKFRSAAAFASWLGLCPDNRVSGGKVLSVKTRKVANRAATALRRAAQSLQGSKTYLGDYYRRMRARLGAPMAITAAAHKLARIIFHMLTTRHGYDESIFASEEARHRKRTEARLRKQAREFGLQLIPLQA